MLPHVSFPGADGGEPVAPTPGMMVGHTAQGRVCRAPEDSRAREALSFMTKAVSSVLSSFNVSPSATEMGYIFQQITHFIIIFNFFKKF